jgi:hypothetical protein
MKYWLLGMALACALLVWVICRLQSMRRSLPHPPFGPGNPPPGGWDTEFDDAECDDAQTRYFPYETRYIHHD